MRGLIVKDLLFIKSNWKMLIIMFIGSLLISVSLGNYLATIVVIPIMLLTSGITTFQTDEFYNTESYTLSFPLSRKKIVLSKFLFTLITLLISTYIGLIIYSIVFLTINPGHDGLNTDMLKYLIMLEFASILVDDIFYPIIYKYGCEKSRYVLMSICLLVLGLLSVLSVYINVINVGSIDLEKVFRWIQDNGILTMSILVSVSTIISYCLSVLFYKHRDF